MKTRFQKFDPKPLKQIRNDFEKSGKYNKKFIGSVIKGLAESSVYNKKSLSSLAKKSVSLSKKNLARNFDAYLEKSFL